MGLFDDLKKKKYPKNGMPGGRMGRVYAGPGQMPGYRSGDEDENEDPNMCDVYAGPGMMDEIGYEEEPEVTESEAEETEAEATETEETEAEATEAEAPVPEEEKTESEVPEPEEEPKVPRPSRDQFDPRNMMAVYAGPEYWSPKPQNQPAMVFVYAGPAQMQNYRGGFMNPQPAPEQPDEPLEKKSFCPECGGLLQQGFRFCPFCGTPLKKKGEQVDV
ncbi:MAG: zinc ribbon domain-containing protein [Lachnospiraceae bacterium]|nr:zinc ribbon domain-containing protein [Lachnospiraceae bacterium]